MIEVNIKTYRDIETLFFLVGLGVTVYEISGINGDSFSQYLISSTYPSNGIFLKIEVFLNTGDNLTDFNFNVQHLDYLL